MVLRNELKYYISYQNYLKIRGSLRSILKKDTHSLDENGYFIRSLYFDTITNRSFYEKMYGVMNRKKYRLRIYDLDSQKAKFEIKNKIRDKVLKETAIICRSDVEDILNDNYEVLLKYNNLILNKIYLAFKKDRLVPTVVVDYVRDAYIDDLNNIRITFDRSLSKNSNNFNIFSTDFSNLRKISKEHIVIMEIKYNHFLPGWIKDILQTTQHTRSAVSKFCLSKLGDLE